MHLPSPVISIRNSAKVSCTEESNVLRGRQIVLLVLQTRLSIDFRVDMQIID